MAPRKNATKDAKMTDQNVNTAGSTSLETSAHVGDLVYDRGILATIAVACASVGFAVIKATDSVKFIELGLVTANPAGPDADGNLQVALTELGGQAYAFDISDEGKSERAETNGDKPKRKRTKSDIATPTNFTISTAAIPVPDHVRGARGNEIYPFRDLAIGHSFHLPCENEKVQEAINSRVNSSVSTANARYLETAHPIGNTKGARFINRRVGADDPAGLGVRVWRVEDLTSEELAKIASDAAQAKAKADAEAAAKKAAEAAPAPAV